MNTTSIRGIQVPLVIPRRGRGHSDVLATVSVSGDFESPYDVLSVVYASAHHTFGQKESGRMVHTIATKVATKRRVESVTSFRLPIERISTTLDISGFVDLPAAYVSISSKGDTEATTLLRVDVPVPVLYTLAKIRVYAAGDKLTFEDIYDLIYKTLGFSVLVGVTEGHPLEKGHTAAITVEMLRAVFRKHTESFGRVEVLFSNPVGTYSLSYVSEWGKGTMNGFLLEE